MAKSTKSFAVLNIMSRTFELLDGNVYTIGNNKDLNEPNFIYLNESSLDCKHATIDLRNKKIKVMDLQSKLGTFLNSNKLDVFTFYDVKTEDSIKFGNLFGRFELVPKETVYPKGGYFKLKRKLILAHCEEQQIQLQKNNSPNSELKNTKVYDEHNKENFKPIEANKNLRKEGTSSRQNGSSILKKNESHESIKHTIGLAKHQDGNYCVSKSQRSSRSKNCEGNMKVNRLKSLKVEIKRNKLIEQMLKIN